MDDKVHEGTNSGQSKINGIPQSTIEELVRLMSSESFINASKLETRLRDLYEPTIMKYESIARMFSSPLWNNRALLTTTAALASLSTRLDRLFIESQPHRGGISQWIKCAWSRQTSRQET